MQLFYHYVNNINRINYVNNKNRTNYANNKNSIYNQK